MASAQRDVPTIKALAKQGENGATSTITFHEDARKAVNAYYANTQFPKSIKGYRIRLYAGNNKNARKSAESAIYAFRSRFNEPIYYTYDNPYFYVAAGNFLSHEEAIIFLAGVRDFFPRALIVSSDIPVESISRRVATQRDIDDNTTSELGSIVENILNRPKPTESQLEIMRLDSLILSSEQQGVILDSLVAVRDSLVFVQDSIAMEEAIREQQRRAREYDILSRTMEIMPEDTLSFELPLDGEFYGVTLIPDSLEQVMSDPRLQEILNDTEQNPIEQDRSRGKSGEWEYLNQPF